MDGLRWPPAPARLPRPRIVRHRHVCCDGTVLMARSQRITATAVTFDRFTVAGVLVATAVRTTPHTRPPDFRWADQPHHHDDHDYYDDWSNS